MIIQDTENPEINETFFSRISQTKNIFRYPFNIGEEREGLHHFMIIKEYKFYETGNDKNDELNGLQNFVENNSFDTATNITFGNNVGILKNSEANYEPVNSFVLFLPPGSLGTSYSADYQEVQSSLFSKAAEQFAGGQGISEAYKKYEENKNNEDFFTNTDNFYTNVWAAANPYVKAGMQEYLRTSVERIKYNAIAAASTFLSPTFEASTNDIAAQSMRRQLNPYTSLAFNGVRNLREHTFNFEFKPKTSDDSLNALKIIANLKKGMLPSLEIHRSDMVTTEKIEDTSLSDVQNTGSLTKSVQKKVDNTTVTTKSISMPSQFFKFPNVYTITFYDYDGDTFGNRFLFLIGQSVLKSLSVKYGNTFFEDDSLPTSISLNVTFKENFALNQQLAGLY